VTTGQARAFGLNFERFVDPGTLLGGVQNALTDATSRGYVGLLSAGLSPRDLQRGNAANIGAPLLERIPGLFGDTPQHLIGAKLRALGLDEFLSQQDVTRYLGASPAERAQQQSRFRADSSRLDFGATEGRAFQDFLTQMSRAGQAIET